MNNRTRNNDQYRLNRFFMQINLLSEIYVCGINRRQFYDYLHYQINGLLFSYRNTKENFTTKQLTQSSQNIIVKGFEKVQW